MLLLGVIHVVSSGPRVRHTFTPDGGAGVEITDPVANIQLDTGPAMDPLQQAPCERCSRMSRCWSRGLIDHPARPK